jgi:hypothetical protein
MMTSIAKILCLLMLCLPLSAPAGDCIGMVVVVRGDVTAISFSLLERTLNQGAFVYETETIAAGNLSFAVIQFHDGARVTVRPNTKIIIEKYQYAGSENDRATINLLEGGLRIVTGAITKHNPENYTVKTPIALMGVRGTEFSIQLCGDQVCE